MSLLNMFDHLKNNKTDVDNIYILLAEKHAEISSLNKLTIRKNANALSNLIHSLFKSYIQWHNLEDELLNKIKFIYQNNAAGNYHQLITYNFLPLINSNDLLTSPIYKNSKNKSVAFLIYPILQTFDVLLYCDSYKPMVVFVAGDQMANVNIMKDICSRLDVSRKMSFEIYTNVIYDNAAKLKMSKSLNNFVNFNDITKFKDYILKYITYSRPSKTDKGIPEECPFHNNIVKEFSRFLDIDIEYVENCNTGSIGCYKCKTNILNKVTKFIEIYITNTGSDPCEHTVFKMKTYNKLLNLIDTNRRMNENC